MINNDRKIFKQYKLKKKWATWRLYKRFFLWKKKITFFSKLKWFFNYTRIIKKYYVKCYAFRNTSFLKTKYKISLKQTSNKIYNFLHDLEFRLDLTLIRIHFSPNILKSKYLIQHKKIVKINNKLISNINYTLKIKDKVQMLLLLNFNLNINKKKFSLSYNNKNKKYFRYHFLFQNKIKNFIEINYKIAFAIYIKPLWNNEVIKKKKKLFKFTLFKKFWSFN